MRRAVLVAASLLLVASCGSEDDDPPEPRTVTIEGEATLDGRSFDSDFVGAVVIGGDGLVTPCQDELPPVRDGRYSIAVLSRRAGSGCGAPGSTVVLWTHAGGRYVYATEPAEWPGDPETDHLDFDPAFDSTHPNGAAPELAQFNGAVLDADGEPAPIGTEVEAFVGDTRCGVASVRSADEFVGYVLAVVGPDAVPGCDRDVAITFRIGGEPAQHDPVTNRPPGVRESVDLRASH
jgi:hypothetical protein